MQKIVKLNRAFLYCCMVVTFSLYLKSYAAPTQGKPVSLTIKNSTLADVLRQVSKKSGLYIYFQDADLAAHKNVTIDVRNKPVENVLHELLDGRGFSWVEVSENTIAVKKKPFSEERVEGDTVATITVTGKVVDEKGEPIPGATIRVKNSIHGATTTSDGSFKLKNVSENASLIISNVSYYSKDVSINGRSSLGTITLRDFIEIIDEAIVIGYGETTRRMATSDITSIKRDEIVNQNISNPLLALQGRVTGMQIIPTSGINGSSIKIQIRGVNSLNFKAEPLIVIDGLPIQNNIAGLGSDVYFDGQLSALSFINPDDIESIDVLKDADATSIYGSRGANGVVLITTRKGKATDTKIDVKASSTWSFVGRRIEMMDTDSYLDMRKEAYANSGLNYTVEDATPDNADLKLWNQRKSNDWQKILIGNKAKAYDARATVSGGNNLLRYLIGTTYHKENTVFSKEQYVKRGNVHFNLIGTSANQRFKTSLTASYMSDKTTLPGADLTSVALSLAPNAPDLYDRNGNLNWAPLPNGSSSWNNPYYELSKDYNASVDNLTSNFEIGYDILQTLNLKIQAGYGKLRGTSFRKLLPFNGRRPEYSSVPGEAAYGNNSLSNTNIEPQLNYSPLTGRTELKVLLGASLQTSNISNDLIIASGFTNDALLENRESATKYYVKNTSSQYKYNAVFTRISFTRDRKYLANFSLRRDGSSRFGPGNRFATFASVGLGWIFTEEKFMSSALNILSYGKIRTSYGTTGNDGIGDYQYFERYNPVFGDPYQGARGYSTTGIFNSKYAWEVTKKAEIGIETGWLNNKIMFTANFFRNRTDNLLVTSPFPSIAGPGGAFINLDAVIENSGLEFLVSSHAVNKKDFQWNISFNISHASNKLISFPDFENSYYYAAYKIGQPFFGQINTFKTAGVNEQTGNYQFRSRDGKIVDDPSDPTNQDGGYYYPNNTNPKYYGGLRNNFIFKGFNIDLFFQFAKQKGPNLLADYVFSGGINRNAPIDLERRWRKPGDKAEFQRVYHNGPIESILASGYQVSSDFLFTDASFVRLKTASLSYNIASPRLRKIGLSNALIYIQAQNILTITGYKGLDPEAQTTNFLPQLASYALGIQLTL